MREVLPRVQVDELLLERRIPRFRGSVIETDAGLPDRRDNTIGKAGVTERPAGVLAPPVRVEDDVADTGIPVPHRHGERVDNHFLAHIVSDGPANHFPRIPVNYRCQVHPSAHRENVRDVAVPQLVLTRRHEVAANQVHQPAGVRLVLHRRGLVRPRVHAGQASSPGQPADPLRAHRVPVPGQVRVNAVDTVPALMRIMNRHDKRGQRHVRFLPRRRRTLLPCIIPLP